MHGGDRTVLTWCYDTGISLAHHVVFDGASVVLRVSTGGPTEVFHVRVGEVVRIGSVARLTARAAVAHEGTVPSTSGTDRRRTANTQS